MTFRDKLHRHDNNRQKCSVCHETLDSDLLRLSLQYSGQYGKRHKRICAPCILGLADAVRGDRCSDMAQDLLHEKRKQMVTKEL